MPENQTAGNFENQGIKETVNQNNQTGKTGGWREPAARWLTERTPSEPVDHMARLAEKL